MQLSKYQIIDTIYESESTQVLLGISPDNNEKVTIKTNTSVSPTFEDKARLKHEIKVSEKLSRFLAPFQLIEDNNKLYLIRDYLEGLDLKEFIKIGQNKDLRHNLQIAIQICQQLAIIHGSGIIHKDINPKNIIYQTKSKTAKIIDFGISSFFSLKKTQLGNPSKLEGTLAYISPEQTGRMNRFIDFRSDFYSLGVTLYELFTGKLPFDFADELELIHAHIARNPFPPEELSLDLPEMLSKIILKLLAKNAEDRYQSTSGIQYDLQKCLDSLEKNEVIQPFNLGEKDFSDDFRIPEKLYGREKEIQILFETFNSAQEGNKQLVWIEGFSGSGKSALVAELYKPLVSKRAFFLSGKFDLLQKNNPYSAWKEALNKFAELILSESELVLLEWKEKIISELGEATNVLIELVPKMELILGKQPSLTILDPNESQNRFYFAVRNFLNLLARREHPLVIFLDDLQWIDYPSLELLEIVLNSNEVNHLLFVGAYRDNEINSGHLLEIFKEQSIRTQNAKEDPTFTTHTLKIDNLTLNDIKNLLQESLKQNIENISNLANIIFEKTEGNAFFINQLLKTLFEEGILKFDAVRGWLWDIQKIQNLDISDDVVEFMTLKIRKLSEFTQSTLKIASCIGTSFDLFTLINTTQLDPFEVKTSLQEALKYGLIVPVSNNFHFAFVDQTDSAKQKMNYEFKFAHDRIQQAFYSLLSAQEKNFTHRIIGQFLHSKYGTLELSGHIFEIIGQLNKGLNLIDSDQERMQIIEMNFMAAQKAKEASAYQPALQYIQKAYELLTPNFWNDHYKLSLALHNLIYELYYLNQLFDDLSNWRRIILTHSLNFYDSLAARITSLKVLISQNKYTEVIEEARLILKIIHIKLPQNPKDFDIVVELIKTKFTLRNVKAEELVLKEYVKDAKNEAFESVINCINQALFFSQPKLFPIAIFKLMRNVIKFSNPTYASLTYANYGLILCGVLKEYRNGFRFGQIALELSEQKDALQLRSQIYFTVAALISHWNEPYTTTISIFEKGIKVGAENGDTEYASYGMANLLAIKLYNGGQLDDIKSLSNQYKRRIEDYNQKMTSYHCLYVSYSIDNLSDPSLFNYSFEKNEITRSIAENNYSLSKDKTSIGIYYGHQLFLTYIFQNFSIANKFISELEKYEEGLVGIPMNVVANFYKTLTLLATFENLGQQEKKISLKKIKTGVRLFEKCSKNFSENFEHRYHILKSELYRIEKKYDEALKYLHQAIEHSKAKGFLVELALSWELCSQIHFVQNQNNLGEAAIQKAFQYYTEWGAIAKANQLIQKYPSVLRKTKKSVQSNLTSSGSTRIGNFLDLKSIIKASQTLSSEVVLEKLIQKMMQIIVENSGAQSGILFQYEQKQWIIKYQIGTNVNTENQSAIPENIINYVQRTDEFLVIDHASDEKQYLNDTYIQNQQVKSVLCFSITNKSNEKFIIYLENNLLIGAFSSDRLEVVKILSTQLNISLENALLYENLEEKVKDRTALISKQKQIIEDKNKHITDSINYAKNIQDALLPRIEEIKKHLPETFIFFKPRDIVSGDFYWYTSIEMGMGLKKIIIVAADCTGHGVPGAFMSMIGINLLNEIVDEKRITEPNLILDNLRLSINAVLRQEESNNQDGMDISLLCFNHQNDKIISVDYAGTNPLYYIQDHELRVIKPDKIIIGGFRNYLSETDFKSYSIEISNESIFYILSDGYQDQFGGALGRKLMKSQLKEILNEIHTLSLDEQKEKVANLFDSWKGNYFQVDDVLMIGIKVSPN